MRFVFQRHEQFPSQPAWLVRIPWKAIVILALIGYAVIG